jgi:sugar lactone lactonase YvrE
MKTLLKAALGLFVLTLAYLAFWPVAIDPVAWAPAPAPALEGPYAVNDALAGAERLAVGQGHGPEAITFDPQGRLYTGYKDGRVVRYDAEGRNGVVLANTGGRPLGLEFAPDGRLIVADAYKGLVQVSEGGVVNVLATEAGGLRFGFADDLEISADGIVYFTDASWKHGYPGVADFLEHRPNGRVIRHELATGRTDVLLENLHFPNGLALGPGDAYLLVNEQAEYRVLRHDFATGATTPLVENLPGLPDNITFDEAGRRFWVAFTTPRLPALDDLAPYPFLRKVVARLPEAIQPAPILHAFVIALDESGRVVANLQHVGPGAYAPVTSAVAQGEWLYLGSFVADGFARIRLPR